jgi:ribosomal-protein-alanine N-acetyltransferase
VSLEENEIRGYIIGELREIIFSGLSHVSKTGRILNIAVDKKFRKRGIGGRLMEKIEEKFKDKGASYVTLEVRESNNTARSFYQDRGYSEIGRVRAYYLNEDAILMRRKI